MFFGAGCRETTGFFMPQTLQDSQTFCTFAGMRRILLLATLCLCVVANAQQQKIGDFIESTSYNLDKIGVVRQQLYQPRHGSFVCENGTNRYTRA